MLLSTNPYQDVSNFIGFNSYQDIEDQYDSPGCLKDAQVLFAYYSYEDYSGSSLVIFSKDGKLYEVNGSHCSCYGLEGQWNPEETTFDFIEMRFIENSSYVFRDNPEPLEILKNVIMTNAIHEMIVES